MICTPGREDRRVGITHERDFPAFVRGLAKVTRRLIPAEAPSSEIDRLVRERLRTNRALHTFDPPALEGLGTDPMATQALCDVGAVAGDEVQAAPRMLSGRPRVISVEPQTLSQVFAALRQVAEAAGADRAAEGAVGGVTARVEARGARAAGLQHRLRLALPEWLDPPVSCGHRGPERVRPAGAVEGFGRAGLPSRTLRRDEVMASRPEVVFIACCGFGVERTMDDVPPLQSVPGWQDLPAVCSGRVYVTDGAHYFSRPGPRLVDSLEILAHTLHPEAHPLPAGLPPPVRVIDSGVVKQASWGAA